MHYFAYLHFFVGWGEIPAQRCRYGTCEVSGGLIVLPTLPNKFSGSANNFAEPATLDVGR